MKKYMISSLVVVAFGIYVLLNGQQSTYVASVPVSTTSTAEGGRVSIASSRTGGTPVGTPVGKNPLPPIKPPPAPTVTGTYKNGSYKGSLADAFFGKLQVEAIISGGALTDVQFLTFPNASGHTQAVSSMALPILKQEAIQSQSANVNIVSGATQTSQAFQQSLTVALMAAKS